MHFCETPSSIRSLSYVIVNRPNAPLRSKKNKSKMNKSRRQWITMESSLGKRPVSDAEAVAGKGEVCTLYLSQFLVLSHSTLVIFAKRIQEEESFMFACLPFFLEQFYSLHGFNGFEKRSDKDCSFSNDQPRMEVKSIILYSTSASSCLFEYLCTFKSSLKGNAFLRNAFKKKINI